MDRKLNNPGRVRNCFPSGEVAQVEILFGWGGQVDQVCVHIGAGDYVGR